ncbi:MAG: two pore domain potassium channel family protein [Deltaproteobacteria bacterium]|nr:two pore domain potassium channel family protein [Deltaproteobacteria bacterium]MBI3391353.1 two pore domain potassium channel family protein [Deltaproteobacteria bacterium]
MPRPADGQSAKGGQPAAATARVLRGRFTGLTIVLVVLFFLLITVSDVELRALLIDLTLSVLMLFAIRSVGRRVRVATAALALPTFICQWTLHLPHSPIPHSVTFAFTMAFLAFLTVIVLITVLSEQTISADTIVGGVCAYLLLGVTWGFAYTLLVSVSPDAFTISPALAAAAHWETSTAPKSPLMQYYSFVTLSTLGYGDMSPLSAAARSLSVAEGLSGQLYLAVLIARLVSGHAAGLHKQ